MTEERVQVATGELQEHARYVRAVEDEIRKQADKVEQGMIPVPVWGVPNYGFESGDRRGGGEAKGHPSEAMQAVKLAYEAAHAATLDRLESLRRLWLETADGLDMVARNYDVADLRGSRWEQLPR